MWRGAFHSAWLLIIYPEIQYMFEIPDLWQEASV